MQHNNSSTIPYYEITVDPDQLDSTEIISTPFTLYDYIQPYNYMGQSSNFPKS